MSNHINLVKLCVGAERVEDLILGQKRSRGQGPDGRPRHITRMWPKRGAEILAGGSLYWVFKGVILARQRIVSLDEVLGEDGISRCALVLDDTVIRTEPQPRRPFQGWRYLTADDAPADLRARAAQDDALPPQLETALAEIGVR